MVLSVNLDDLADTMPPMVVILIALFQAVAHLFCLSFFRLFSGRISMK
jgi:hypothetical protein